MNRHGFTLVELLATIVIIALLSGIGIIAYNSVIKEASDKAFEAYRESMHGEAIYYVSNNSDKITWQNNTARLSLNDLKMDPINNPKDKNDLCQNSYVDVVRERYSGSGVLSINYTVCLICNDYNNDGTNCKTYDN